MDFLGIQSVTAKDKQVFVDWLRVEIYPHGTSVSEAEGLAINWFLQQKAECPAKTELDRLVRSAFNLFEQCLHETVALSLSPQAKVLIDSSLNGAENAIEFSSLKADPGRVGLDSVLTEAEKLQFIRSINLSLDVFQSVSTKALKHYYQRICSESTWDVKQHPPEVKYSLFAIFLFFRQREIIDGLIELFIQIVHRLSVRAERKLVKELLRDF
ncbi:MAG: hypothetical protein L3J63_04510 [Geopsychrobacter sp.]|nr:hypothetical protein [Geopsychrobacter sp.]